MAEYNQETYQSWQALPYTIFKKERKTRKKFSSMTNIENYDIREAL